MMKQIVLLLVFSLSLQVFAKNVPDAQETHGGDAYAAEFLKIYGELRRYLVEPLIHLESGVDVNVIHMDEVRAKLKVESFPELFRNGREVSAVNTPALFLIQLSQKHWNQITREQKEVLVLHEFLPVMGIIDDSYVYSADLAQYIEGKKSSVNSPQALARSIMSCNSSVFGTLDQAQYESFPRAQQDDFLMLASIAPCPAYLKLAISLSSKAAVKTSCEDNQEQTPLANFLMLLRRISVGTPEASSAEETFALLYEGPQDRLQSCAPETGLHLSADICELIQSKPRVENPLLQSFSNRMGCN